MRTHLSARFAAVSPAVRLATLAVALAVAGMLLLLWPHHPSTVRPAAETTASATPAPTPSAHPVASPSSRTTPTPTRPPRVTRPAPSSAADPLEGDLTPVRAAALLRRSYPDHSTPAASRAPVTMAWSALRADLERGGYRAPDLLAGIVTPARPRLDGTQDAVLMWGATTPAGDRLAEQVSPVTIRTTGARTTVTSLDQLPATTP